MNNESSTRTNNNMHLAAEEHRGSVACGRKKEDGGKMEGKSAHGPWSSDAARCGSRWFLFLA